MKLHTLTAIRTTAHVKLAIAARKRQKSMVDLLTDIVEQYFKRLKRRQRDKKRSEK